MAVDAHGNIYIADAGNNRIRKVSASGDITHRGRQQLAGYSGDGGPATNAEVRNPYSVLVDSSATSLSPTTGTM